MKFVIAQSALLESLKIVSRAVSGQNTLPVLGNILIKAEGKKVHFFATNLEISIATSAEATVKNEGAITVPAKILTSYTSLLEKNEDIEVSVSAGTALEIKTQNSKTKIKGISADEFPAVTKVTSGTEVSIPYEVFRKAVHEVAFSAQENSSRPILSGVYFYTSKKELRMVATDSYRLSEKIIQLKNSVDDVACVIPVRALLEADRLVSGTEDVLVRVAENQVLFTIGGHTQLTSRLIDGQFPDYKQIIPKNIVTTIEIDRSDFELAVRRVSIFAKENNQHMKLSVQTDGVMIISTDATEIGEDKATLSVDIKGDSNAIALNSDYVLDILGALSDKKIRLELEGLINPAVFRPLKGKDFTHLIMPLKM